MNFWIQRIIAWPLCLLLFTGFILTGNSNVLCFGEDGHIEFEAHCHPLCEGAEEICAVDISDNQHSEHGDGAHCSHIKLNPPLWSGRTQTVDSNHVTDCTSTFITDGDINLMNTGAGNSRVAEHLLAYGQNPPSYSIATTVLRC